MFDKGLSFILLVFVLLILSCNQQESKNYVLNLVPGEDLELRYHNCFVASPSIDNLNDYQYSLDSIHSLKLFDLIFSYPSHSLEMYKRGLLDSAEFFSSSWDFANYCNSNLNYRIPCFSGVYNEDTVVGIDFNRDFYFDSLELYSPIDIGLNKYEIHYDFCSNKTVFTRTVEITIAIKRETDSIDLEYCFANIIRGQSKKTTLAFTNTFEDHFEYMYIKVINEADTNIVFYKEPFYFEDAIYRIDSIDLVENNIYLNYLYEGNYPVFEDLSLLSLSGDEYSFANSGSNTYKLIHFWGSWCYPCLRSFPLLVELYSNYNSYVDFVGVCTDDTKEQGLETLKEFQVGWRNLYLPYDSMYIADERFIYSFPTYFVLDTNSNILLKTSDLIDIEIFFQENIK